MIKIITNATESAEISSRELLHRKLARETAGESIVLLQNDGALPADPCPVALFGAGAAATIKGGTGSGEVNERYSVTIEQGLKEAGFNITTDYYLREYEVLLSTEKGKFNKTLTRKIIRGNADDRINIMANHFQYPSGRLLNKDDVQKSGADFCLYIIARQAGECSDRKLDNFDFNLTENEIANLKFISENYTKTVVVINAGGQMDLSPLDEININAVLYFCQQGMEGGNALADILTGAVTPSGCLSSTWPLKYEDMPNAMEYSYLKGHTDYEEYKEGIYVGYRYFDSFGVKPRYEFGYGLSYTGFDIDFLSVIAEKTVITVAVNVTNTGAQYSGKKTVQLYISAPGGKLIREYQSLVAFSKTENLLPGQSQELTLSFPLTSAAGYDEESSSFILEQGDYIVRIGESSLKTKPVALISLESTVVTEVCKGFCKPVNKLEEIYPKNIDNRDIPADIIKLSVSGGDFDKKIHCYDMPEPVISEKTAEVMKKLNTDDMIKVVCGTGVLNNDHMFRVPGAAGNTTSHLESLGVPNSALCDGPAGLRLQRRSVRLKNEKIKPVDPAIELMECLPWLLKKLMYANPNRGTLLYQYTSAFPVGTALAQTWNTKLLEEVGIAVGTEMVEFGATYLLAPGMNIQRNPLCGRNYEYFSEDPVLSGKAAAAITTGVQSKEGCYVTIKHYIANNQEDNRNKSDSRINERAFREIYLKGYRIAVEEGGAKSVMTSYNKLNGVYTPNSYDLCTSILRCEWGFEGVVMTDWFSTGKGLADNGEAIKAGNDLIMPGGKRDLKEIKESLISGALKEEELRLSCTRIIEAAINGRTGIAYMEKNKF